MIQIPVMAITENNGEFTFEGPNGMSQSMSAEDIEAEANDLRNNYEMALKIARCHWWKTRQLAEDKTVHDAQHSRLITWAPDTETAVAYGD